MVEGGDAFGGDGGTANEAPRADRRRLARGTMVAVGVGLGWAVLYAFLYRAGYNSYVPAWLMGVDVALGAAAALTLVARPRYPLAAAVAVGLFSAVSSAALAALVIALIGLTARRPWWQAASVAAGTLLLGLPWFLLLVPRDQLFFAIAVTVLLLSGCLGWGSAIRSRLRLIERLREDVLRARADRDRRLDEARADERRRIAREMHDVLAHRMSLLSVHAGALAYRVRRSEQGQAPPPTAEELGAAVEVIRDNAHRALDELGGVLAVLRAADTARTWGDGGTEEEGTAPPQPTLADLDRLLREATGSGQRVSARVELPGGAAPLDRVGRSAYRVVQEGLTNARKHAPGARVEVRVHGGPGLGLAVSVRNPLPVGTAVSEIPGAGAGITGLAERVGLDGGTLTHGPDQGLFLLDAQLPWADGVPAARPPGTEPAPRPFAHRPVPAASPAPYDSGVRY
ncbi:sensor histidine kinase [Nocardiopsis sp. CC223A]|uniref:sensor histidine kinase n=1 Tax=Nocardiopsis sp. CC223A TaxID=3044051 RepID=UPI00278BE4F3|nr:histidine kinase [Nocardiopsis sp. CC223A]